MIEVLLQMKPPRTTAQQKGVRVVNGKPFFYEKDKVKNVKEIYMRHLAKAAPDKPLEGAISLSIVFKYSGKDEWKTTRPDLDNMEKLLIDSMTQCGYWLDDAQISSKYTAKRYGEKEGIEIRVATL